MRLVLRLLGPVCALTLAAASGCSSGSPSVASVGAAGSAGTAGSAGDATTAPLLCKPELHPTSPLSLLTRVQYDATIADLLGDTSQPSLSFPPENQVVGFNNNTEVHIANPLLVEQLMDAAEGIAGRAVTASLPTLAPCVGSSVAELTACGATFVSAFGKRAFRRPLTAVETQAFNTLFAGMNVSRGYSAAVELTIQAMLQSPQFLYRVDGASAATPETGAVALDPYQLASRLSYFLTNSMPDEALFSAADAGNLASAEEIETQARRLIETPKAHAMVRDFNQQWLRLDQLAGLARNPPDDNTDVKGIGADYAESLQQFLDHVYWDKGDLSSLFLSPNTYVNARLAAVFGLDAPKTGFAAVNAAPGQVGLLTQPALMAMLAHSDQSGPVQRGVFVREQILCIPVPPPPPNFNPIPPDPDPSLTTRERFAVHTKSAACAACHKLIDGTGFGFESYDQLGRYRSQENGLPVDASGEMIGTGEPELDGTFVGAAELSQRIAKSPRAQNCLASNWFRYAMGRVETDADACSVLDVQKKFLSSGGQFKELLVALTLTDAFRYRPAVPEDM
jgi:Protein of unknown function (DUF1592)/Protein of unknown function (DUF1588)/Protein of unknown function (DUF1595)/Protein of unknown function (DUF1587)/Protein of unknown function (DUF1585)